MNADFSDAGLSFHLVNISRTLNPFWFEKAGPDTTVEVQDEMKAALRRGDKADLNIWTVGFIDIGIPGLIGYATLPSDLVQLPGDDGVVLRNSIMPNGTVRGYQLGRTATHEVGHWVGVGVIPISQTRYI